MKDLQAHTRIALALILLYQYFKIKDKLTLLFEILFKYGLVVP